jgi:Holliday junction DNA helicase RuvA
MISAIEGSVIGQLPHSLIVNVSGVGYRVFTTPDTLSRHIDGDTVMLWTHLVVRDDAMELYGFLSRDELAFFELLLLVSGIGPRSALGIIGLGNLDKVKSAIAASDSKYLTSVAGIGKKSAEKIVVELRDKIADMETFEAGIHSAHHGEEDVVEALKALGYTPQQAREALGHIPDTITETKPRLKEALKYLTSGRQ